MKIYNNDAVEKIIAEDFSDGAIGASSGELEH
jgi:hypothetical protein